MKRQQKDSLGFLLVYGLVIAIGLSVISHHAEGAEILQPDPEYAKHLAICTYQMQDPELEHDILAECLAAGEQLQGYLESLSPEGQLMFVGWYVAYLDAIRQWLESKRNERDQQEV